MRNKKIEEIEDILSKAMPLLSEADYLNLIKSNDVLKLYDEVSGKIENNEFPENYLNKISNDDLDKILEYLKEAINL